MSNIDIRLREIVYKLLGHDDGVEFGNGYHDDCKEEAEEAITQIKKALVGELPEEKGNYGDGSLDITENGYNQALTDIKERLK